ncbi:MAG TPA: lysophospholipid acyltransferase family protein [Longimicrobiales bacterium]
MRDGLRLALASHSGRLVLDALFATARFEVQGAEYQRRRREAGAPVIYVLWHGRLLPPAYLHRGQGVVTLISRSRDGEVLARLVQRWGYLTVRGSSTRGGGTALRELVRHARAGRSLCITPDGPRGPRQKLKPGVLQAARMTGLPIVPVAAGADRAWWFGGWDRFLVPRPFARIRVVYGAPHEVPRDADAGELARRGRALEAELDRLVREADGDGTGG